MLVLTVLAPVFLLIAIGAAIERRRLVSPTFLEEANRLTYWLGLPALLFVELATSSHRATEGGWLLAALLGATLLTIGLAYLAGWFLRVPGAALGTFVQGGFRGNLAYMGLPIVFALPETTVAGGLSIRVAAVIVVAPTMLLYNIASVMVLLLSQHRLSWRMIAPFLGKLARTPPLVAIVLGFFWAWLGWPLPAAVAKTCRFLGEMSLPLGLLGVGGAIVSVKLGGAWRASISAALLKTIGGPLAGAAVALSVGLDAASVKLIVLLMATPTAVASYAVALELKGDPAIASGTIVLSTLFSAVGLSAVLAMM